MSETETQGADKAGQSTEATTEENRSSGGAGQSTEATTKENRSSGDQTTDPFAQTLASLDDELRSHVEKSGYKDVADIIRSNLAAEKMLGARGQMVSVPQKGRAEDPNAWLHVDRALGVPEDGNYGEFRPAEGELALSKEQLAAADKAMHAAGATPAARNAALAAFHELNQKAIKDAENAWAEDLATSSKEVQRELGAAYAVKMQKAERGLAGVPGAEAFEQLMQDAKLSDHPHYLRLKAELAELREEGEAPERGGQKDRRGGTLQPDEAMRQIKAKEQDQAFMARYLKGDPDATEEMTRLYSFAYPKSS